MSRKGDIARQARALILSTHTEFSEFILGLFTLMFGIASFLANNPTANGLPLVFSLVFVAIGSALIYASFSASTSGRRFATFASCVFWGFLFIFSFLSSEIPNGLFSIHYAMFFVFSTLLNFRAKFTGVDRYGSDTLR